MCMYVCERECEYGCAFSELVSDGVSAIYSVYNFLYASSNCELSSKVEGIQPVATILASSD